MDNKKISELLKWADVACIALETHEYFKNRPISFLLRNAVNEVKKDIEAKPKYDYNEEVENAEVSEDEYYMTLGD